MSSEQPADVPVSEAETKTLTEEEKALRRQKNKDKKKKKKAASSAASEAEDLTVENLVLSEDDVKSRVLSSAQADLLSLLQAGGKLPKGVADMKKEHAFWQTQPVLSFDQKVEENGPIETKTVDQVMKEPYPLPSAFQWEDIDMNEPAAVDEVYNLLSLNYVEDDECMFRFDYSREFLRWALMPPGYRKEWHVGVREIGGKRRLMGFITGVPAHIRVYDATKPMVEINFLCVHKKLRSKRLAPVLIKEITRRVNVTDVWQAVYTAGVVLPKPVAQNRYYHRSLNPKKLIDIGFSRLHPRMTMTMTIKLYALPKQPVTKGIRELTKADIPQALTLLNNYLTKFNLVQQFSAEEFEHIFLPRKDVVHAWVVEDNNKKLTDMISFYCLPSSIIGHEKYNTLKAAYSYYNVSTKTPWEQLMTDALIYAKQLDYDVFNALNVMENDSFLKPLKFGIGDGHLQYYLYNWKCPEMSPSNVGLVLL